MKRAVITISDSGTVTVPSHVRMTISEIADLSGIYCPTAKRHIRSIEKSGIAGGDYAMSCSAEGTKLRPDYYGLEMVVAVAFRAQSAKAEIFRRWIAGKAIRYDITTMFVLPLQNALLN